MAIDTAAKRRAISGILSGLLLVGVTPDVLKPVGWRQQAGWGYSGITVAAVVESPDVPWPVPFTLTERRFSLDPPPRFTVYEPRFHL